MGNRLHYCSVYQRLSPGLSRDPTTDVIHAKMGALAFFPVEEVERVWRTLKLLIPADMVSFISYFESTWVGTSTTSPLFSHDMWNQHDASLMLIPRSSNIASWVPLNAVMFQPYTLEFLEALKSEQALTDQKLAQTRSWHRESSVNYQSHEPQSG